MKEQFAWKHFYWSLTNKGIPYLRSYLHLPPEIVACHSAPETGRPRPKGLEGDDLQDSHYGKPTETHTDGCCAPLVLTRKLSQG